MTAESPQYRAFRADARALFHGDPLSDAPASADPLTAPGRSGFAAADTPRTDDPLTGPLSYPAPAPPYRSMGHQQSGTAPDDIEVGEAHREHMEGTGGTGAAAADGGVPLGRRARRAAAESDDDLELAVGSRRPGEVEQSRIRIWDDQAIAQYRGEWHDVKAQFVDDPTAALTRARDLLTEAVHELSEALLAERDDLDPARQGSTGDTESMRVAMRGYREFLDRILTL